MYIDHKVIIFEVKQTVLKFFISEIVLLNPIFKSPNKTNQVLRVDD